MSYVANQYNHATPLSSVASLVDEQPTIPGKKLFTLFDNVLDGSYYPIDGDVGIWSAAASDANGTLPTPFTVTVTESLTINAFRLVGDSVGYPVAFTVRFYNGSTVIYTITETANTNAEYVHYLPKTIVVTKYEVVITKISTSGVPARVYNLYNPGYIKRIDALHINTPGISDVSHLVELLRPDIISVFDVSAAPNFTSTVSASDTLPVHNALVNDLQVLPVGVDSLAASVSSASEQLNTIGDVKDNMLIRNVALSHILKTLGVGTDTLLAKSTPSSSILNTIDAVNDVCPVDVAAVSSADLTNIHSIMKRPSRRIYGKVYITYTDPMLDSAMVITNSGEAYNSNAEQIFDGDYKSADTLFTLYDNNLSGKYVVADEASQVGWVSSQVSDANGRFSDHAPYLRVDFSERPISSLQIVFDDSHGSVAEDFTVDYIQSNGQSVSSGRVGNTSATVDFTDSVANVVAVIITVTKVTKPFYPVAILEVPTLSTYLYVGYHDRSDLMSIDLLEELTYEDDVEALGGISANEVSITLDNSSGDFYFNNTASPIASSLLRNRRIEPWLGVEIANGEIEWYALGTFWSYKWDVPVEGLIAKVVSFDTIGLLDKTDFKEHTVQVNKSIGQLVEYVLTDAKKQLSFLTWNIDDALYDIVIPYAWFDAASHTEALRKISACYPMHIYCDREGAICAAPQKLHMDFYYDTWSDRTNVISKSYSSLHTALPNIINVEVKLPKVMSDVNLVDDDLEFDVTQTPTRILNFNEPYITKLVVGVGCDETVHYSYEVFSWGIIFSFSGTGKVYNISCTGTALNTERTSTVVGRNEQSIRANGAVKRDISSDFIQKSDLANEIINRILSLSEYDKYDVEVEYRGDISLTINDPILLLDGIAPDNRYNIRRHELFWDGSLHGSAHLNT